MNKRRNNLFIGTVRESMTFLFCGILTLAATFFVGFVSFVCIGWAMGATAGSVFGLCLALSAAALMCRWTQNVMERLP